MNSRHSRWDLKIQKSTDKINFLNALKASMKSHIWLKTVNHSLYNKTIHTQTHSHKTHTYTHIHTHNDKLYIILFPFRDL